jgi:DNA-binding NarL/FixJ family response regulator
VATGTSAAPARTAETLLPADLTPREREVLTLIGEGLSNRAIAQRLFVSEATVKTHINNLFAKTGVRDRAEAVRLAFTHGLVG